jgi:hypothetical protein
MGYMMVAKSLKDIKSITGNVIDQRYEANTKAHPGSLDLCSLATI